MREKKKVRLTIDWSVKYTTTVEGWIPRDCVSLRWEMVTLGSCIRRVLICVRSVARVPAQCAVAKAKANELINSIVRLLVDPFWLLLLFFALNMLQRMPVSQSLTSRGPWCI